jgi:hypothetical protein
VQSEIQKTTNYQFQYYKLNLRFRRLVDAAVEILKESPTEYQNRITHIGNKKEGGLYRFRMPGCYLLYVLPERTPDAPLKVVLTGIKVM